MEWRVLICRAVPDALAELGEALARPEWDVAVLHGVPTRWAAETAARTRSEVRLVRAVSGGRGGGAGADVILSARDRIVADRGARVRCRLRTRTVVHGVWLACGLVVVVVDGEAGERGVAMAQAWAAGEPLLVVGTVAPWIRCAAGGVTAGPVERGTARPAERGTAGAAAGVAGAVTVRIRTAPAGAAAAGPYDP